MPRRPTRELACQEPHFSQSMPAVSRDSGNLPAPITGVELQCSSAHVALQVRDMRSVAPAIVGRAQVLDTFMSKTGSTQAPTPSVRATCWGLLFDARSTAE